MMDFLFGYNNEKQIKEYESIIRKIMTYSKSIRTLSDIDLKNKTNEFRKRIDNGESLDDILPEAFAVVREASRRYIGIEQYPVQMMGAIALHRGDVAEMKTGEGKTYTAPLAAYLNTLTGKTVHIATSNDTLASRDRDLVAPLFEGLGLTVGVVTEEKSGDYRKDLKSKQEAYACDITYGSSNAFAFDYLRDNTATEVGNIVRGDREIGFIIIDEADQILVNDAVMPFKLSGSISYANETAIEMVERQIEEEKQEENQKEISDLVNQFIYELSRDESRIKEFKTEEQMHLRLGGNKEATYEANKEYTILYSKEESATLTERGWLEAFRFFNQKELEKILKENKNKIIKNPNFKEGIDYQIKDDKVELTLIGLEKATREIEEIKELNSTFYSSSKFASINATLENALKAYFVLEKGKEYILDEFISETGKVKKRILLVSNGRTAEGRVYSDGLQQAIELKEKIISNDDIEIEMTSEHGELASISQKAFYSIYPKISGMTGTSAKELFEEVYGMYTVSIPKNSEYNVTDDEIDRIYSGRLDKDTILFETEKEKIEAVIASALESQKTGQPVLISTTSVNESNKLYEIFTKMGISCEKLNAEVKDIKEENAIIARAGIRGSITISTQMAGRGTDIKLGGSLEDHIEMVKAEEIERITSHMATTKGITKEQDIRKLKIEATSYIERKKMDDIVSKASERYKQEQRELVSVGGLKVIGYGHYQTKRDDDQLRGRAARQADPGVTEFYCSVRDLRQNLGVSRDKVEQLRKKGLSKGNPISGIDVEKVVASAQNNTEGLLTTIITNTQESDYHLARMRKKVYDQRMRMLKGESPKENMEYIIETSVVNLISKNLPEGIEVSPRKKIKNSGLDINNFIIDIEETFGIDLTEEIEENKFKNIGQLEEYIATTAVEKYREIRKNNHDKAQDAYDRKAIIGAIDEAWLTFNSNLDDVKRQHLLNNLAQNKDYDEIYAMKRGFNQAMIDSKIRAVSKMLGKTSTKKRTEEINEELSFEETKDFNQFYVEERKKTSPVNLMVRPAKLMSTISSKIKLIKDELKYQFQAVTKEEFEQERVERMDFEGSNVGYQVETSTIDKPSSSKK